MRNVLIAIPHRRNRILITLAAALLLLCLAGSIALMLIRPVFTEWRTAINLANEEFLMSRVYSHEGPLSFAFLTYGIRYGDQELDVDRKLHRAGAVLPRSPLSPGDAASFKIYKFSYGDDALPSDSEWLLREEFMVVFDESGAATAIRYRLTGCGEWRVADINLMAMSIEFQ